MGNCIIKESSMQWGGDDWSTYFTREYNFSDGTTRNHRDFYAETERTGLLEVSSSPNAAGTKVKLGISKKLLRNIADVEGSSAHEILTRSADASDRFEAHRRPWTPALQSIPE